ncbi:uncharacterized protein BT62DRAFT_947948 [Guyanagaster necrorhizus]|uniref:Chitin biosynthesis protein n=1 Tax=Guyanagaster necrorhizus TaxID=856835 RepID=A0A9P7VUU6_9AGAR|nr:uncharacterized protein BT62DRAFT_947948 [Guyanagaster necrorhizus MCA 3950]KAG7447778.1 hypothetical protein BT62DRAFT_947948 [Guyanagaster necrorhizus MCA 3950]
MEKIPESFTFTVGKLDAGMAILLGERAHLIEFPSVLLPPGATTGSIVSIAVHQNHAEEKRREEDFWSLQEDILKEYGVVKPSNPDLQLRHVTQTSVTLEWPSIQLATAKLRSLDIYRNGERLASIPSPLTNTSTKLSGLQTDEEYTFQLILRTTAGTFPSNIVRVRTHTMTNTSGISVCFGNVQDSVFLENTKMALREMKAKWSDKIQIDTTHFICTTPAMTTNGAQATGDTAGAPGIEYQRALQLSIPVLYPDWVIACYTEKRMVPIGAFDLKADRVTPLRSQSLSQVAINRSPDTAAQRNATNRASMPATVSSTSPPGTHSPFVNQPAFESTPEEAAAAAAEEEARAPATDVSTRRKSRSGTMNREFKFPSPLSSPTVAKRESGAASSNSPPPILRGELGRQEGVMTPSSIEVPPPPPVEKERSTNSVDETEDDVGPTVEVDLS